MKKLVFILVAACSMQFAVAQKPNSKFGGVQIGVITYSYRSMPDLTIEAMLNYIVQSGINSAELSGAYVEKYAGIPQDKNAIPQWRATVSMDKFKEIKNMFDKRGVKIDLFNFGYNSSYTDEEIDYAFRVAKALGARGVAMEISEESAKRAAPFAEKHKLYAFLHNHGQPGESNFSFDKILALGPRLMLNFDVGHYYAATGLNPCDLIKRLNKRIAGLHLKDRTWVGNFKESKNVSFGEGETPLIEILLLLQKEKYPIVCHIEQEYKIPENSDAVKEVIKCVAYCKAALIPQKPNSKFGGVQIGAITYSYRSMPDQTIEGMLKYTLQSGISSIELMGAAVEKYAGIPQDKKAIPQWRATVSMDKFKGIKQMFDKMGVKIHILKLGDPKWSDEEIDYAFNVCKTLGAQGISMEISEETAKRMSPFADKHKLYVIFHNHGQSENPNFSFDKALEYGPRLMLNFDAGHYYAATGKNPCDVIKRLNKRIFSIHLKDRTWNGTYKEAKNLPFGEGQTPIVEMLQLIQKEKWPIYCDIELEYSIPQGSDAVKEVIKCVEYCRKALVK